MPSPWTENPQSGMAPAVATLMSKFLGVNVPSVFTPLIGGALSGIGEQITTHAQPADDVPSVYHGALDPKASQAGSELRSVPPGGGSPASSAQPAQPAQPTGQPAMGSPEWYAAEQARIQGLKEQPLPQFTPPLQPRLQKTNLDLAIAAALAGIFMKGASGPAGAALSGLERGMQSRYGMEYQRAQDKYQSELQKTEAANKATEFELSKELQLAQIAEKAKEAAARTQYLHDALTERVHEYARSDQFKRWALTTRDADAMSRTVATNNAKMTQLGYERDTRMQVAGMTMSASMARIAAQKWVAGLNNDVRLLTSSADLKEKVSAARSAAQGRADMNAVNAADFAVRNLNQQLISPDASVRAKAAAALASTDPKSPQMLLNAAVTQLQTDSKGAVSIPEPDLTGYQTTEDQINAGLSGQPGAAGINFNPTITVSPTSGGGGGPAPRPADIHVQTDVKVDASGKPVAQPVATNDYIKNTPLKQRASDFMKSWALPNADHAGMLAKIQQVDPELYGAIQRQSKPAQVPAPQTTTPASPFAWQGIQ